MTDLSNLEPLASESVPTASSAILNAFGPECFWNLPKDSREHFNSLVQACPLTDRTNLPLKDAMFAPLFELNEILPTSISRSGWNFKPAFTQSILVRKSEYFVRLRDGKFNYYRCLVEDKGSFFVMKGPPPVISEGLFIINKEIYFVTEKDARRRMIRKARKLPLKASTISYDDILTHNVFPVKPGTGSRAAKNEGSENPSKTATLRDDGANPDAGRPDGSSEVQEQAAIELAFQEQIRSLLNNPFEEIEWQASQDPQPQRPDAPNSIQNPDFFT